MGPLMRASAVIGAMVLLGGCSSVNFYSLEELTEEKMEKLSFPVHSADMSIVRSKFLAYTIALYGRSRVERYSGKHQKNDATVIYGRLLAHMGQLKGFEKNYKGQPRLPALVRVETVDSALRLVGAAIRPTKRYYEQQILGIISAPGPTRAIAIAKTAFKALQGVAVVKVYREAMLNDANFRYHQVVAEAAVNKSNSGFKYPDLLNDLKKTCPKEDDGNTGASLSRQVGQFDKNLPWTYYVSPMVRGLVCKADKHVDSKRALALIKGALEIGKRKGPWKKFNAMQNSILLKAGTVIDKRLEEVCNRLKQQAGLKVSGTCLP